MAYDKVLAARVSEVLAQIAPELTEKKMFGGVAYMIHGNIACGVHEEKVIVRVGPDRYVTALQQPETVPFDITGRSMKGWVMVLPEGYSEDAALKSWLLEGIRFAQSLPQK